MIGLQRAVHEHEDAVEADLQRYYQVDYRDRWRDDPVTGVRVLTWRRLRVLLKHLPSDSAWVTACAGQDVPQTTDVLLMQVWELLANQHRDKGKPEQHPTLKALREAAQETRRATPTGARRQKALAAGRARLAAARAAREARQRDDD